MRVLNQLLLISSLSAIHLSALASNVVINNADFDAQQIVDGSAISAIQGWRSDAGLINVFNPSSSVFAAEAGDGIHQNVLIMINEAKITQTSATTARSNTQYTLSFDIGQRPDVSNQNYTISVKAGETTLLYATNPIFPSLPGTFSHTELTFDSGASAGEQLSIEIETTGTGHSLFDNFELSYTQEQTSVQRGYSIVAWGHHDQNHQVDHCILDTTLLAPNGSPYMTVEDTCECNEGSVRVLAGYHRDSVASAGVLVRWFFQCVLAPE